MEHIIPCSIQNTATYYQLNAEEMWFSSQNYQFKPEYLIVYTTTKNTDEMHTCVLFLSII
jgi:hypothetical protein